jgi:hypothetical protein
MGDRNRWYCVVDAAGQIQLEQRVRTIAKALSQPDRTDLSRSKKTIARKAFDIALGRELQELIQAAKRMANGIRSRRIYGTWNSCAVSNLGTFSVPAKLGHGVHAPL